MGGHTEDEFLGGREHVQREGDLVLVALPLEPAEEGGCIAHGGGGVERSTRGMIKESI